MTIKDEHASGNAKPAAAPKPATPAMNAPLSVQCFTHRGELVVVFSAPVKQWFLTPDAARQTAKAFSEMAAALDAQESAQATKQ